MDVDKLRHFCTMAETRNLRMAAVLLGRSPGTLSKSLAFIERELGIPLLQRTSEGLKMTHAGERFYEGARLLIGRFDQLCEGVRERTVAHPSDLRIGSFEVFTTYFLCDWLVRRGSDLRIECREFVPGQIEQALLENVIDVGFTYAPTAREGLELAKIGDLHFGVFCAVGAFESYALGSLPFAVPTTPLAANPGNISSLDGWPDGVPRTVRYQFELLETALIACRKGMCAIYGPTFLIRLQNELCRAELRLVQREFPASFPRKAQSVYLVRRKGDAESKPVKSITSALRLALKG